MAIVTLVTGGNLGNRYRYLSEACRLIDEEVGDVLVVSSFYESEPWGFESENPFLNQAIIISTPLDPYEVLERIGFIEQRLGRTTKTLNGIYTDRPVDIDIIFYDDQIICDPPRLVIPHPEMHKRRFVLDPIREIASSMVHPVKQLNIAALSYICSDPVKVALVNKI